MSEQELQILEKIIMVVLQVAIPPLLAWGIAELKRWVDHVRDQDEWQHVFWAVRAAVSAAEQLDLTGQLAEYGESKLQVAIGFVEAQLAAAGIPLDVDQYADAIRAMIEDEVRLQFPHEPAREWVGEDGDGGKLLLGGYPADTVNQP